MSEPKSVRPLQLGRGLRILTVELVQVTGVVERYELSRAALTVLTGPRNSSKTTTLKVIDYCFGEDDSVASKFGSAIDEKYQALAVEIAIDGVEHRLVRDFGYGLRGKVQVDEDGPIPEKAVSDWLLRHLGWPQLTIPLGRNPLTATQQTPLSFRSALRHIYRREDSWTEFAIKEQEYLRRAVVSLFLGFAPQRYETADFELGQAQRTLAAAEAVLRSVLTSTDEAVHAFVSQLGLPPVVDANSLDGVHSELSARLEAATRRRDELSAAASRALEPGDGAPGLEADLPRQLQEAVEAALAAAEDAASFSRVVSEYRNSQHLVQADIARLRRLVDAVEVFNELPVRVCPACEQAVNPQRTTDPDTCYLCTQPVTGDVRRRRAERENRALEMELSDLAEALARTESDLASANERERAASDRRAELARRLHDERATRLAPFMATLEDIATEIGRVEQQLAALPALGTVLARRATAEAAVAKATEDVERLAALAADDARAARDTRSRCAALADHMNEFLTHFRDSVWIDGLVTISSDDLTFYVGTRPWDQSLGAETKVLFFLAYSYALVRLSGDADLHACPPGVLLLDNPYQQGLALDVVQDAINRIGVAADEVGAQVVLTQARSAAPLTAPLSEVEMPDVYAG